MDAVVGGAVGVAVDGDTSAVGDDGCMAPPIAADDEARSRFCEPDSGRPTAITELADIGVVLLAIGRPFIIVVVSSKMVTCCGRIFSLAERAGDE